MTSVTYYADTAGLTFFSGPDGQKMSWVHALPGGTWQHPVYGELKFDDPKVERYAESVVKRYRQIDPDIDYDHKQDAAMGNRAAGWVKNAEARPGEKGKDLWLLVEWTPNGYKSVQEKEFRYFSSELADEWTDAQGNKFKDVVLGGGVTNRPYMKNLVPLNLSELSFKDKAVQDKGDQVDPKELRRKLGLSEAATDAEVDAKLSEVKLGTPPVNDNIGQLAKLAEDNPVIKAFMDQMAQQTQMLKEANERAATAEAQRKLGELTPADAKVSFTAALLNDVTALMVGAPQQFSDKMFAILKSIVDGNGLTQLGEKGSTGTEKDHGEKGSTGNAEKAFNDAVDAEMKSGGLSFADALTKVSREKPQLYSDYRKAVYIPADA
jgi:phage I-like protein